MVNFEYSPWENTYLEVAPQDWIEQGYCPAEIWFDEDEGVWSIFRGFKSHGKYETPEDAVQAFNSDRDWQETLEREAYEIGF